METLHDLYLLTGGNLGNREMMLSQALQHIREKLGRIDRRSSVYQTEPWGFESYRPFLNQVLKVRTALTPAQVLSSVLQIELILGRIRQSDQYVSRVIDIDILFYDDLIISQQQLTIPHPLLHERRFALVPLAEIAPRLIHPVMNTSIQRLLIECPDKNRVETIEVEATYGLTPKPRSDQ